jgi:peptide/nickel transport system permease protein
VPVLASVPENIRSLILPSITLGTALAAIVTQQLRSGMLEVLRQDYVRTAHAKGLSERQVVGKHALISVVTVVGLQLGGLLGNTIITETLFALPGVGRLMIDSIFSRDFFVVQGVILFLAAGYVVANLLVDLLYSYLDPRIRGWPSSSPSSASTCSATASATRSTRDSRSEGTGYGRGWVASR